jgi:hypothetical protein
MTAIPGSTNFIQVESVQFNQPVSESSLNAIGALANYLRSVVAPIGTVIYSMLDQDQMNVQVGGPNIWVIADGSSAAGTTYGSVTGNASLPDLRGVYPRGKNYGRSTTTGNPDGNLAVGTYQGDQFGLHNHNFNDPGHTHGSDARALTTGGQVGGGDSSFPFANIQSAFTGITFNAQGGNETRPRSVTLNPFIRIN